METCEKSLWPGWSVVRLIGRGSYGAVYEIERETFGYHEQAAIKHISIPQSSSEIDELISEGYDEESITRTFEERVRDVLAEYALMRKLNGSANAVNCDDYRCVQHDNDAGWDIYIKMELLKPLSSVLSDHIEEEQVVIIGTDLCKALVLCGRHHIVHRDIKPSNIFVSENGDYKLGDFGIAKTVEKTSGGTRIGTYEYMAPEVYMDQPYGSGADIYSLGMVLYWLLNKRRTPFLPLPPKLPTAKDKEIARRKRLSGENLPLPATGGQEIQQIVFKACAYKPEDRYQSAEEMLNELETIRITPFHSSLAATADNAQRKMFTDKPGEADEKAIDTNRVFMDTADEEEDETVGAFSRRSSTQADEKAPDAPAILAAADFHPTQDAFSEKSEKDNRTVSAFYQRQSTRKESANDHWKQPNNPDNEKEARIDSNQELTQFQKVIACENYTLAIRKNGTIAVPRRMSQRIKGMETIMSWTGVVDAAVSDGVVLAQMSDGALCFSSDNSSPVWPKTRALIGINGFFAGLGADGDVYCDVTLNPVSYSLRSWRGIEKMIAGFDRVVGLRKDGGVQLFGGSFKENRIVNKWVNVVDVAVGHGFIAALTKDGTIQATGGAVLEQSDSVLRQTSLHGKPTALSAGRDFLAILFADGVVRCFGIVLSNWDNKDWENISQMSAGNAHLLGIKKDGKVVAAGNNSLHQCELDTL